MSNGRDTVKIYGVTSRGRPFFQLSFYRAGLRERRTFSDKDAAKREAKIILGQLASSAVATDKAITVTDIESLVAARAALDGLALPLHVAVEAFARSVQALGSPENPVTLLMETVYNSSVSRYNGFVRLYEQGRNGLNVTVDQYNGLVGKYESVLTLLNRNIDTYNSLPRQIITEIGGGINLEPSKFAIRTTRASSRLTEFQSDSKRIGTSWTTIGGNEKWISSGNPGDASPSEPMDDPSLLSIVQAANQTKHWKTNVSIDGSWKSAVKLSSNQLQEKSYNGQKQELQVSEFSSNQLQSLIVAHTDANGRIVFQKSTRTGVLPPQDPPRWYSPN